MRTLIGMGDYYRELNKPDSWNIKSLWVIAGKEGEPFLEMQLVAVKPSIKQ